MPLISDGEYQYEYNDFVKVVDEIKKESVIDYTKPGSMGDMSYLPKGDLSGINQSWEKVKVPGVYEEQKVANMTVGSGQPPPPVSATPPTVTPLPNPTKSPVKIATPQYVKFDRDKEGDAEPDQDFIKLIFFEQINGVALLSLTNSAKLDTGTISYQPIINMAETIRALNPKNIVALQDTSDKYFLNFPIKLETKIPNVGNGPDGINVYRNDQGGIIVSDLTMGAIIIEAINLGPRENIQIETLQSGTIYKTNLGNEES